MGWRLEGAKFWWHVQWKFGTIDWILNEGSSPKTREQTRKTFYGNNAWRNPSKHTVVELATGNKHKEEWTFLPRNWRNPVYRKQIFFNKNFALFGFLSWYTYPKGTGDILLLNMASRKKFWMKRRKIEIKLDSQMNWSMDNFLDSDLFLKFDDQNELSGEVEVVNVEATNSNYNFDYGAMYA